MANTKKKAKTPAKNNGVQSGVLRSKNRFREKYGDYPVWAFDSKKEWLQAVRKRWTKFRRAMHPYRDSVMSGSAFYPKEVYDWLKGMDKEMEQMTKRMREYYKNA